MNSEGIIEQCNQAAEVILGFAEAEMKGKPVLNYFDRINQDQGGYSLFEKVSSPLELTARCKDESLIPIELTMSKSFVKDKTFYIMIFRNIQERKQSQHNLAVLHERLVSTARIAGMAEVATCVLHNVGNVLNSINVSARMLLDRHGQDKIQGC